MCVGDRNNIDMEGKHERNVQREKHWETIMGSKTSKKTNTVQTNYASLSLSSSSSATTIMNHNSIPGQSFTLPNRHDDSVNRHDNVHFNGHIISTQTTNNQQVSNGYRDKNGDDRNKRRSFHCHLCLSCYTQKGDLVRHFRCVHQGLRPYQCNVCGNAFGRRSILNKHMRIHTRE